MDQNLLESIRNARLRIESRGRALRNLIALGEPGRQSRAASIVPLIQNLKTTDSGVEAIVPSGKGEAAYRVSIKIHRRAAGNEVCQGHTCTCWDHNRVGSCKHVLAVAAKWIRDQNADWSALKKAEKVLTINPET